MRKLSIVAIGAIISAGFAACATNARDTTGVEVGDGSAPQPGDDGSTSTSGGDGSPVFSQDGAIDSPFGGCAKGTYAAKITPAAMLFVLDKSGTMGNGGKWASAQQAIVQAVDQPTFDSMSVGLLGYPTISVTGPACILNLPVTCGVTGLPQVPVKLSGTLKTSDSSGVRHDMYQWLSTNTPAPSNGDGNPTYDALKSAIGSLKGFSMPPGAKRILAYVTAGGASCASVSSPLRPGYKDGNNCNDWEYPDSIVTLLKGAHDDVTTPVNTMIVGVAGADTHGENLNVPPYAVRLALSAYAWAGSPETCDATCTGKTFSNVKTDPAKACHWDMTTSLTPAALAGAIASTRGNLLGCTFDLPDPGAAGTIDPAKVNVDSTTNGTTTDHLKKRKDASDLCASDGCWDYTTDTPPKVQLIGKACDDVKKSTTAKVEIVVGCTTIVK